MTTYVKFRFTHPTNGATAGLIIEADIFKRRSITELSRWFPYYESSKMHTLESSPEYPSWDDAFNHEFGQ